MAALYPMLLLPTGKNYLWGGERLKTEFGKNIDLTPLAETWECSSHPDGPSIVINGAHQGRKLSEVLLEHPEYLGTKFEQKLSLPILIKLIDAEKDLSVQVHPDDEYASKYEVDRGKTEMWYILDAQPGAEIVYGFNHPVDELTLRNAIAEGDVVRHLHRVRASPGDTYFIPAGTVHAIGAGILLAEIQESSNLTYRVYDYDRVGPDGKKRSLAIDKAVKVMDFEPSDTIKQKGRLIRHYPGYSSELICRCKYFEAELILCRESYAFTVRSESFQALLCIEGECLLEELNIRKGDCVLLPAGYGVVSGRGNCRLIKVRC